MPAKIYDFTLTANGSFSLQVQGGFYKIMTASAQVSVTRDSAGALGPLYPGQGERADFSRLIIKDLSGAANVGTILIADTSFVDDRVQGDINIYRTASETTRANQMFMGTTSVSGLNYNIVQLWNAASNTTTVEPLEIQALMVTAADIAFCSAAAARTLVLACKPLLMGGAVSNAQIRTTTGSGAAPAGATATSPVFWVAANEDKVIRFEEPIVLVPGTGIDVFNQAGGGSSFRATFKFRERVVV